MMKKLLQFLIFSLILLVSKDIIAQVTIPAANTNTTNNGKPFAGYFGFERTGAIYTAAEHGMPSGSTVNSVSFYLNAVTAPSAVPVKIYMTTTTSTVFTSSTYASEITGLTEVYSGTISTASLVAGTWITVALTTPFLYNSDNLKILVETNVGGSGNESNGAKQFRWSAGSAQTWYADNFAPIFSGNIETTRPNVQLAFTPPIVPATHLNFDGVDDYVNCGVNSAYDFTTGTIEAWIKPNASSDNQAIMALRTNPNNIETRWSLHVNEANNTLGIYNGFGFSTIAANIDPNQWYHVAFVMNSTQTEVYVNGVSVGTINSGINTASTGNQLLIGFPELVNYPNERFSGSIDDVRIWNVARTATQINAAKNCELQGSEAGLVAYYKFNQGIDAGSNTAITSATATTGSDGTLTNFALTGATSNWLAGSPVTTGSTIPNAPTAFTQTLCGVNTANSLVPAISATIKWYASATATTALVTTDVLTTATYYVAAVNANGCESNRTAVNVYTSATPLTANFIVTNSTCGLNNGSASVAPTGGTPPYYYLWSDGSIQTSRNNLSPGNYWYVVTDFNGCNNQETYFTISNVLPTAPTVLPQSFCGATTASSLVPAISSTIKWYTDNTTTTALTVNDVITSGTYYVAEALTGCESTRTSVAITVSTIPNAPTGLFNTPAGACFGATASDLRPEISSTIKWYASATATTALAPTDVVTTGTYYAAAVNANGCESTRTPLSILVNTTPVVANFTLINSTCGLNNGSASVAPTGGAGTPYPYSILWSNGQIGNTINNLSPGNYSYLITDSNGCTTPWINFTITDVLPTAPTAISPQVFVGGANIGSLTATGSNLKWYAAATGGTVLDSSEVLVDGTTYYVSQTTTCESARTAVVVSINTPATHLNFDGANDRVDLALPSIFDTPTTNAFSVEVLVNPTALLFSRIFFAQKDLNNFFSITLDADGGIFAYLNNTHSARTNASINTSTWTLVTITKEANTNTILIYFNGVLQATSDGGTSSTGTDNLLTFGSRTNQAQFFNGNLDEVRIWNRVLPVNEIVNNFNCELQNPLSQTGLVGYYKFNQGVPGATNTGVTTATATVGSNGTLNNFALTGVNSNWLSGSQIVTGSNCTPLKINDFSVENELKIYPNPSKGIFNISIQENANIKVNDLLGKVIYTNKVKSGNNTIDISNYQSGIYLLNIASENGSVTKKIIKE